MLPAMSRKSCQLQKVSETKNSYARLPKGYSRNADYPCKQKHAVICFAPRGNSPDRSKAAAEPERRGWPDVNLAKVNSLAVETRGSLPWLIFFSLAGDFGLSRHVQSFVGFCDDMIDYHFHIMRTFERSQLSISTRAFAHDALDVCHLAVSSELVCLAGHKFEQFV
jgi:hypothetical protein